MLVILRISMAWVTFLAIGERTKIIVRQATAVRMTRRGGGRHLVRRLTLLQVIVAGVLALAGVLLAYLDVTGGKEDAARAEAVSVALTIADSPAVVDAVLAPEPGVVLQPFVTRVRRDTGADLVAIVDPGGRLYAHSTPARGGERAGVAHAGSVVTETYTSPLGPAVRAVAPVRDGERVVALVSVGVARDAIAGQVGARAVPLVLVALGTLAVGLTSTCLVSRRQAG